MLIWLVTLCYDKARARKIAKQNRRQDQAPTAPNTVAAVSHPVPYPFAQTRDQPRPAVGGSTIPPAPTEHIPLEVPPKKEENRRVRDEGKKDEGITEVFERGEYKRL